jgi:hypothetical protein
MQPTYPGALGKRSHPKPEPIGGGILDPRTDEDKAQAAARNVAARLQHQEKGLALLSEYYKIPGDLPSGMRYLHLALALAYHHVPYFRVPGSRTGPQPRVGRFAMLEVDIEIERRAGAKSVRGALIRLCGNKRPWRGKNSDPNHWHANGAPRCGRTRWRGWPEGSSMA